MKYFLPLALLLSGCGAKYTPPAVHLSGDLSIMLAWLVAVSILGLGLCTAAAIFLPVKKLASALAAGFAVILGIAITVRAAEPYLPWVLLAMLVVAGLLGIYLFRKYALGMQAAIHFGLDMAKADSEEQAEKVRESHAIMQAREGVKNVIDHTLTRYKK